MQNRKQKITILFLLAIILFIPQNQYVHGAKDNVVYFFETDRCLSCMEVKEELSKYPDIDLKIYNIGQDDGREFLFKLAEDNDMEAGKLLQAPIIVYNDKFYIGQSEIMSKFIPIIQDETPSEENNKISILLSLLSGLLNGFNPCSIAMYLYVVSLISTSYDDRSKILKYLLLYILSIYISYLLIGLLLSKGYIESNALGRIGEILQIIMGILFAGLAIYYFKDYLILKQNKNQQLKTQLGGRTRSFMEAKLKDSISSGSILSPIISGFLVAILSFSCTGQIYVATLFYVFSKESFTSNMVIYLLFYNLMLILPLLVFTFLIYKGKKLFKISLALSKRLKEIKLATSIFFALVSMYILASILL